VNLYDEKNAIEVEIRKPGPFWFDDLGPLLAKQRWAKLDARCGIEKSNYGTNRVLEGSPFADRRIVGNLKRPVFDDQPQVVIETLGPEITRRYHDLGLEFYPPDVLGSSFLTSLNRAVKLISNVRGAAVAASSVLSVIHILKPKSPEYDVSYSEPSLPFSIFVGVSLGEHINGDLRLAESILHECMHLQLTLIENHITLVEAQERLHHSPWRQTLRPTRGVLHALYVFRVIQDFFRDLNASVDLSESERSHIVQRLREIDLEVHQMGDLSSSPDLTQIGRALVQRLQIGNRSLNRWPSVSKLA
jgi:hypothetical protein